MAFNRRLLLAAVLLAAAAVFGQLVGNADAATYVVGDSLGWTIPPGGPVAYSTWASQHEFKVGDVLVFNFSTGLHDAAYVTKAGYDGCSSNSPIALATVGPASFTLNSTGEHHYICTFGQHCSLGQKLAINVTAASTPTAPAPAPSSPTTPPSPAPTPAPSGSLSPSPSPSAPGAPSPSPSAPGAPSSAPTPSGSATPPPSPTPGASPGSSPPPSPPSEVSPPPPSNSATLTTISAPFIMFASIAFGLMI
ncbi:cucumber peeling cupredoxin [Sesamum indicum]|uniref:Cucumber peeling cupredoxin n=1 Tax=Sesamum indicum TaxID=4182 RepID=A0A6I9T5Q0_SESIN|nr:cucumber peeling cupredoxin [Sesamum indicum]